MLGGRSARVGQVGTAECVCVGGGGFSRMHAVLQAQHR
jgi:Asp/Glu/hydantoin racemase